MRTGVQARQHAPRTWPFNWRLILTQPRRFALHSLLIVVYFVAQIWPGLIERAIFNRLTGAAPAGLGAWELIALYVSVELGRHVTSLGAEWYGWNFRLATASLLRRNLFAAALRRPGALSTPVSAGEAVSRYRDDVMEVSDFPTWLPWMAGQTLTFVVALLIMAGINLPITLVIFVPLLLTVVANRLAWSRYLAYRYASRRAAGAVSSFLGEVMSAVKAVKVANAEEGVIAHMAGINEVRRRAAVRDRTFEEALFSFFKTTTSFGIGVMLLLAGQAMVAGSFTVGDFALFVYYLWFATELPALYGSFIGDYQQQAVSIQRLADLAPDEPATLVQNNSIHEQGDLPPAYAEIAAVPGSGEFPPLILAPGDGDSLQRLEAQGLTYIYGAAGDSANEGGRGIVGADLVLERGSFTVVTGRVGSGKTTLLRVLLGLLPMQDGEVRWNNQKVAEPASFFRPPRVAYTPQAPRLFSASLSENVLLGLPPDRENLRQAVWQAVLELDVAALEHGLATVVGPRGVRLSGGQVQRAAAARMFARRAQIVVFDDLSSALDVETEAALWDRLASGAPGAALRRPAAVLAVSHRPAVLERADQVIVVKDRRIVGRGSLSELLISCPEMRYLWAGHVGERS